MAFQWDQIRRIMQQRRAVEDPIIQRMIQVRDRYNGDVAIPLTDVKGEPEYADYAPQLVLNAVENLGMRAASTRPTITVPALDPAKETGIRSKEFARTRRRALYATWHFSAMGEILLRRIYRQYAGYGTTCFMVVPDMENNRARVELRDPLTAYPDLRTPDDVVEPRNVGFIYGRPFSWLWKVFPEARGYLGTWSRPGDAQAASDGIWDIIEWVDEDDIVIGILGPRRLLLGPNVDLAARNPGIELTRRPNKSGMVPVAIPRRVTLDRVSGQVEAAIKQTDLMGKLTALDVFAAEKAIVPDVVLLGKDGRPPQLITGAWKDGRTGEVNEIVDGDVKLLQSAPGPLTHPVLDRLERAGRLITGDVAPLSGEAPGSLRTGRAIDSMAGFSVDPRIQEAQEIVSRALTLVNRGILEVEKGYWPSKKFTVFSGWPNDKGSVEYVPTTHFETCDNVVAYPFPGADITQITVAILQMTSGGIMSRESGRVRHPSIDDAEHEGQLVTQERIDDALLAGVLQQGAAGTLAPVDMAAIRDAVGRGQPLHKAVIAAHEAAQKRQAAEAPPPGPGQVSSPDAQPGLSPAGMAGAEAGGGGQAAPPQEDGSPGDQFPKAEGQQIDLSRMLRAVRAH